MARDQECQCGRHRPRGSAGPGEGPLGRGAHVPTVARRPSGGMVRRRSPRPGARCVDCHGRGFRAAGGGWNPIWTTAVDNVTAEGTTRPMANPAAAPVFVSSGRARWRTLTWLGRTAAGLTIAYLGLLVLGFAGVSWVPAAHLPFGPSPVPAPALPAPVDVPTADGPLTGQPPIVSSTTPPQPGTSVGLPAGPPSTTPRTTPPKTPPSTAPTTPPPPPPPPPPPTVRTHPTHPTKPSRPPKPTTPTKPTHPSKPGG